MKPLAELIGESPGFVGLLGQIHFPQPQGRFMAFLAEAHPLGGRVAVALEWANRGLQTTRETNCVPRSVEHARARGRSRRTPRVGPRTLMPTLTAQR